MFTFRLQFIRFHKGWQGQIYHSELCENVHPQTTVSLYFVTDYTRGSHLAYLLFKRRCTTEYFLAINKPTNFSYKLKICVLTLKDCLKTEIGIPDHYR